MIARICILRRNISKFVKSISTKAAPAVATAAEDDEGDDGDDDEVRWRYIAAQSVDKLISSSREANVDDYIRVLQQCGNSRALGHGKRLHEHIIKVGYEHDRLVCNLLVQMYGKCGCIEDACKMFQKIQKPNVFSWTIMIDAYAETRNLDEAWNVFYKMPERNEVSWTSMITAYAENGKLLRAEMVFDRMPLRNRVSWTAMITAYSQNGQCRKALLMFGLMDLEGVTPDDITFISTLDACADLLALADGKEVHLRAVATGFESDVKVGNCLVSFYGKCGSIEDAKDTFDKMNFRNTVTWTAMLAAYAQNGYLEDAEKLFETMPRKTVVSWNAMIAAYVENGKNKRALQTFRLMDLHGSKPDPITFISTFYACASLPALQEGRLVHACCIDLHMDVEVKVGNAIMTMYTKCGRLDMASILFRKMQRKDAVSWNSMLGSYAQTGHGKIAIEIFKEMNQEGIESDEITFVTILSGCSHSGLLEDAIQYFSTVNSDYGLHRVSDHYACMVDLFGRLGRLQEAEELINSMPFDSSEKIVSWTTLLAACKVHGDLVRAARIVSKTPILQPRDEIPYVLLTSILSPS